MFATEAILAALPDEAPGITARELLARLDGVDPGIEYLNKGGKGSRFRSLRVQLRAMSGVVLSGDPRYPPMRWSKEKTS